MSVYTLNLRVFWPLLTCVLTGLVFHHHITHWLSPESGPDPGYEAGTEPCSDQGPPVFFSLIKLLLACVLCYLFIRYCSTHPGGPQRVPLEAADGALKSGWSRREVLEDYYERWVRLSPHVLGHSKAHVAKLVGELVRAGRATGGIPESSLAFRGDFLQVGSSYEEHKVGAPDYYDILVPLKIPRDLRLEPRVYDDSKVEEQTVVQEEGKEVLKDEVKEEMKGESSEDGHQGHGSVRRRGGGGVYRLTPDSVLRWFYPAVQRCLATVRYPFEQRCTLSLALADDRVQLRLTPRSDYVCCHISMAIRLLPAIPLGDGVYLVPMETTASAAMSNTGVIRDQHQNQLSDERDLWTLFFPRQEQRLLGWLRGRSPQPSCHLKVLQLTKALRDLGGQALDSHRGALWRSVLSSYTLKTAWLRLLLSSPAEAWEDRHLVARMEELVRSLRESLQNRALDHLFLGSDSSSILPDSVALPKLVKEAVGAPVEGSGGCLGGSTGNLWAGVDPASLDLVSGRLAYAWSHLHRLIRLGRPQRSSLGLGRTGNINCQHLQPGE
ncbi:inositol 1,4,5-trisphosphate receptor-interacting protein-like 2 [Oncorhynchus keta]|uniref:inositol 1,4,5-trisphosphate receptor-interacting protein-like 2 n=1 Tax=Oncorhynchus keta TaxID=8018 RepID=UPI00227D3B0D|nr:inositol 1,4,5-trisphosphate receptor-interacting protein-like 2 [Oncorhynchus keta]